MEDPEQKVVRTVTVRSEASKGLSGHRHVLHGDAEVLLEFGAPADVERAYSRCRGGIPS